MMISLPSELDSLLTERAGAAGLTVEQYVEELVRRQASLQPLASPAETSPEPDGEYEELRESVI